jgi:hypothetical protein
MERKGFLMRTGWLARVLGAATLVAGIATAGSAVVLTGAGAAVAGTGGSGGGGGAYTCTGGNIPAGTYKSIVISGVCFTPSGNVRVQHNLTIEPGALLDNGSPGDPSVTAPVVAAQLYVGGNLTVEKGGVALLGCSPNSACPSTNSEGVSSGPPGISSAEIRGSLTAIQPLAVVVHSSSIGGNFTIIGGGGNTGLCAAPTQPLPWSADTGTAVDGNPVYTDVEDATIGGNYTIVGMSSCWLGSLRNQIGGNATFIGNTFGDPDAMEIGNNLIRGNMTCFKNDPAPQFGDGASSDLVGGRATGQCAFDNLPLNNPAAEAIEANGGTGVGVLQQFVVSTRHLKTYFGTYTETAVPPGEPIESIPTVAGNTISAQLFNFSLAGNGLVGTGTYNGGPPGQSPGAAVLSTTFPNGSSTFTAYLTCDSCSFAGQSGSVSLRAYGRSDKNGFTTGTFLITSNGTVLPSATSPVPGLATLVGYGSFWGSGNTLHLIEHLGFG